MGSAEARDELWSILGDGRLAEQAPLLIWANKMDVEGSITETELSERLALWTRPDCTRRQWCIQGSVMHDRGLGVEHGMKWLYLALSQKQPKKWTSTERHTVENDKVAERVTATKPNAKPSFSAASAAPAAHESSSGSARLCSTAESIVEGGDEEEVSDDDGDGSQEQLPPELSVQKAAIEEKAVRGTLSGTGTSAEEVAALRTVWNTPYVANFNVNSGKSSSGSKGREFRVLLTGMEGAGKTTFMLQLQKKTAITWAPPATPVEGEMTMQKHREHSLIVWDMNGSVEGRAKWGSHVDVVGALSAIIFVVDATEKFMFSTARLELERVMRFKNIDRNVPLLLVANKMDLNGPLDCTRVAEALALEKIHRRWRVQECSATLGTGVEQAMDWLCAAEGAKPRKYESDLLAEENSRLFSSDSGTASQARRSTSTGSPASRSPDADIPAYQMGANYRVTKVGGKGKGQQLKLSCGAVGVNTFKYSGEHVKSYPYKELADWIQGTQSGKEIVTLFKRDRNMAGTEFLCDKSGDASRIIADLDRMVRGVNPVGPVAQPASAGSSQQSSDVSERLERARQLLWAALEADEQDLPAIAVRTHACSNCCSISAVRPNRVDCSRCCGRRAVCV
jgi:small GTP-binding protein